MAGSFGKQDALKAGRSPLLARSRVASKNSDHQSYDPALSLAVSFATPLEKLFFDSFAVRAVASVIVLCLPVFFAGIIFVSSFAKANFRGSALGSNLFGSLAGGLLESLSLWFGLKSLIVLAAIIYAGSAIALLLPSRVATASTQQAA